MTDHHFEGQASLFEPNIQLGEASWLLRGFALPFLPTVWPDLLQVTAAAPFRQMETPGGYTMSVALTNCGALGWTTDRSGYRYTARDPVTQQPWPDMPPSFLALAAQAAAAAGFPDFVPDACLINRYAPKAKMSLHQDKNERDLRAPIVSVSLGLPATFLFGGHHRSDRAHRVPVSHGDVVVWGGPDRMRFHGILPVADGDHAMTRQSRINFTFRIAA